MWAKHQLQCNQILCSDFSNKSLYIVKQNHDQYWRHNHNYWETAEDKLVTCTTLDSSTHRHWGFNIYDSTALADVYRLRNFWLRILILTNMLWGKSKQNQSGSSLKSSQSNEDRCPWKYSILQDNNIHWNKSLQNLRLLKSLKLTPITWLKKRQLTCTLGAAFTIMFHRMAAQCGRTPLCLTQSLSSVTHTHRTRVQLPYFTLRVPVTICRHTAGADIQHLSAANVKVCKWFGWEYGLWKYGF